MFRCHLTVVSFHMLHRFAPTAKARGIIVDQKYGPCVQGLSSDDFFGIFLFFFCTNHWTFFRILLLEMSPLPSLKAHYCKAFFVH
jgi:hypothetical protein